MHDSIVQHVAEIDRCNQRGGRMLSIVDLIEAGTFTRELAAYSLAAIRGGASFMTGALPGGAGKTTVMAALLNFVPPDVSLAPADSLRAIEQGLRHPTPRQCFICHEISDGPYYAYLWDEELRRYFDLAGTGHVLATNLHADTFEQAHAQVCGDNRVPEPAFRRMNILFFIALQRSGRTCSRRIAEVWESDGQSPHRPVFGPACQDTLPESSRLVTAADMERATADVAGLLQSGARTIEEVRRWLVAHSG